MRFPVLVLLLITAPLLVQAQTSRDLSTNQQVLAGTEWRLVSLGPSGNEADVVAGTTVTLKFGEDGRAGGSTGCNTYGGTYEVRGDTISFGRLVSTRRACLDQNANEQEHRFLAALEAAQRFRLSSNRLTILSDRGRTVLNFVSNSPSPPDDGPRDDRSDPWRLWRPILVPSIPETTGELIASGNRHRLHSNNLREGLPTRTGFVFWSNYLRLERVRREVCTRQFRRSSFPPLEEVMSVSLLVVTCCVDQMCETEAGRFIVPMSHSFLRVQESPVCFRKVVDNYLNLWIKGEKRCV